MRFVFLNGGMGLHQSALADAMYRILGDDFTFIEFGGHILQEGSNDKQLEGKDLYSNRPYILKMYESEETERKAKQLLLEADAVRTGGEPLDLILPRLKARKLTFRSSERHFKNRFWYLNPFGIHGYLALSKRYRDTSNSNYFFLCLSGFMANDLALLNAFRGRIYKFAYFTEITPTHSNLNAKNANGAKSSSSILSLLWCARFIDWKHPEMIVELAKRLRKSGRTNFIVRMIGADNTILWQTIKERIESNNLTNHVLLMKGLANTEVLRLMKESDVFVFTSDRGEGWGAVLNEAMSARCACVASNEIGAVPFLLKNNHNGLIFKSRSNDSLFEKVSYLYDNPELITKFGNEAYKTITNEWSADEAAHRLIKLSESILNRCPIEYSDGPCSKALPIKKKDLLV